MIRFRSLVTAVTVVGLAVAPAMAQNPPAAPAGDAAAAGDRSITLELNNLTQVDNNCRVTFLTQNQMSVEIGEFGVQIVLFDQQQQVTGNFVTLKIGRMGEGRSRVRQFILPDVTCDSVSSILINDVTECAGEGLDVTTCLDALRTSSKVSAALNL